MSSPDEYMTHLYKGSYYLQRIHEGLLDENGDAIGEVFAENDIFSVYHFDPWYKLLVFTNRDVTVFYKNSAVLVFQYSSACFET